MRLFVYGTLRVDESEGHVGYVLPFSNVEREKRAKGRLWFVSGPSSYPVAKFPYANMARHTDLPYIVGDVLTVEEDSPVTQRIIDMELRAGYSLQRVLLEDDSIVKAFHFLGDVSGMEEISSGDWLKAVV